MTDPTSTPSSPTGTLYNRSPLAEAIFYIFVCLPMLGWSLYEQIKCARRAGNTLSYCVFFALFDCFVLVIAFYPYSPRNLLLPPIGSGILCLTLIVQFAKFAFLVSAVDEHLELTEALERPTATATTTEPVSGTKRTGSDVSKLKAEDPEV